MPASHSHRAVDPAVARKRAFRSQQRRRARGRAHTEIQTPSAASSSSQLSSTSLVSSPPSQSMHERGIVVPAPEFYRVTGADERFLLNLRKWTHEAFVHGKWDTQISVQHHSGRHASRVLSSDLTAGTELFAKGKHQLAWEYWRRASARFRSPDLFKTWYHETPLRLLFEVGRLAHRNHHQLAASLLRCTEEWAHTFLDANDSRHALFKTFGELQVGQLRELYIRAAHCLRNGLESRIDKHDPLLYQIRLNRALDMLWYDAEVDLKDWLPSIEEVDEALGPYNPYSVYFLLLEAYRLIAQESYPEADQVSLSVSNRLTIMKEIPESIDPWRVGLAYRRLGRQQHLKRRLTDARRSFNTALRYVSGDNQLTESVLIEICEHQLSMAQDVQDQEDMLLWSQILSRLSAQSKDRREDPLQQQILAPGEVSAAALNGRHSPGYARRSMTWG